MPTALFLPVLTICTALAQAPSQGLDPKAGEAWQDHPGGACWEVLAVGVPPVSLEDCHKVAKTINAIPNSPGVENHLGCMELVEADGGGPDPGAAPTSPIPPSQGSGAGEGGDGDDPNAEQHL